MNTYRLVITAFTLAAVSGCATIDKDAGFTEVKQSVQQRVGKEVHWNQGGDADKAVADKVEKLLTQPLHADAAVQIALLNNPRLQSTYEELGIAQANLVQAGLLSNPVFHGEFIYPRDEDVVNLDLGVSFNFLNVFTIPLRKKIASARFEQAKQRVTAEVMDLAVDVRDAFVRAQAAQQAKDMMQQVVSATEAAVYAARRLREAGNITELRLSNQLAMLHQTKNALANAEVAVLATHEKLNVLLGLWGEDAMAWQVAGRLPDLPEQAVDLTRVEQRAVQASLDLAMQRLKLESIAQRLGLAKNTRLVPELELGYVFEREHGKKSDGFSVGLEIPIFDFGQARVATGYAELRQAQREYRAIAIELRSAVRMAREQVKLARARTEYTQKVMLPLSQSIVADSMLQYNAMQLGVFDLLRAQERQIGLGKQYIDNLRDYWIARTHLEQLLKGRMGAAMAALSQGDMAMPAAAADSGGH